MPDDETADILNELSDALGLPVEEIANMDGGLLLHLVTFAFEHGDIHVRDQLIRSFFGGKVEHAPSRFLIWWGRLIRDFYQRGDNPNFASHRAFVDELRKKWKQAAGNLLDDAVIGGNTEILEILARSEESYENRKKGIVSSEDNFLVAAIVILLDAVRGRRNYSKAKLRAVLNQLSDKNWGTDRVAKILERLEILDIPNEN